MKNVKYLLALFATLIVVAFVIVACKKHNDESIPNQCGCETTAFSGTKDVVSDKMILEDVNFKKLIKTNTKLMGLLVESKVDPDCFVFDDNSILCQQLGVCEDDLLFLYGEIRESMENLVANYEVKGEIGDCPLCLMSETGRMQYLRDLVSLFRDNPEISYDLSKYYVLEKTAGGGDDFGPCEHPIAAIACSTLCLATIEIPVLLAMCCYGCICTNCPNNPLCVNIMDPHSPAYN